MGGLWGGRSAGVSEGRIVLAGRGALCRWRCLKGAHDQGRLQRRPSRRGSRAEWIAVSPWLDLRFKVRLYCTFSGCGPLLKPFLGGHLPCAVPPFPPFLPRGKGFFSPGVAGGGLSLKKAAALWRWPLGGGGEGVWRGEGRRLWPRKWVFCAGRAMGRGRRQLFQ